MRAGNNVGTGNDYTLYSKIEGTVKFETKKGKSFVSVYPTVEKTLDPNSRRAKKYASYTPRAELRAAGIAVRRGDTFPGLDADHIRVAVRPAPQVAVLAEALRAALPDCRKATFTQSDGVNVAFLQQGVRA